MDDSDFDKLCDRFEASWRDGKPAKVEDLLRDVEKSSEPHLMRALLQIEIEWRLKGRETPTIDEYAIRFPDCHNLIADAFAAVNHRLASHPDDAFGATFVPSSDRNTDEMTGQPVGHFKLLQRIGKGGMGEVYLAAQSEPVKRRVALKVIKTDTPTKEILARFEAERQALAMMDHQNIARVLDAGATKDGRPYFAMELVKGVPITEYCDKNKLTPNERLDLFVQTCRAIQHAHMKGIVHRDIKPSNVLVTLHDGQPTAKVIDFGLAKAVHDAMQLTDRTLLTQYGQVVGTLAYMSPEQAEMNTLDVDTRTDVYSLGVILYELLTGSTPIPTEKIRSEAFDRILALIREEEAPRPSQRLSDSGDQVSGISDQRKTEPKRLSLLLKGDLDWIAVKALEKDRTRRYDTPAALADDVHRYLRGEPVEARPPSFAYQFQKAFVKHRTRFLTAGLLVGLLVAGLVGTGTMWFRSSRLASSNAKLMNDKLNAAQDLALTESRHAAEQAKEADRWQEVSEENLRLAQEASENAEMARLANQQLTAQLHRSHFLLANRYIDEGRVEDAEVLLESITADYRDLEWHLLKNQTRGTLCCYSHQDIQRIHLLASARKIVSVCPDGILKTWDLATGREVSSRRSVSQEDSSTSGSWFAAAFDRNSALGVIGNREGRIRTFDILDESVGADVQLQSPIVSLAWGRSGTMVYALTKSSLDVIDIASRQRVSSAMLDTDGHCLALSPDGKLIAAAFGSVVKLFEAESLQEVASLLTTHQGPISCLAISPNGRILATGGNDQTINLFDLSDSSGLGVLRGHAEAISRLKVSPNGRLLASCSDDASVMIWNLSSREVDRQVRTHSDGVKDVLFSEDNTMLLTAGRDGQIHISSLTSESRALVLRDPSSSARTFALSSDGEMLASGGSEITIWNVSEGVPEHTIPGNGSPVSGLSFSADRSILAIGNSDGTVRVWNLALQDELCSVMASEARGALYVSVCDPDTLYTLSEQGDLCAWSAGNGQLVEKTQLANSRLTALAVDPTGTVIAVGDSRGGVTLFAAGTLQQLARFENHRSGITDLAFSFDGTRLASTSFDKFVSVIDLKRDRTVTIRGHTNAVNGCGFSRSGNRLVTGSSDNTIRVWDTDSGSELISLNPNRRPVIALATASNGSIACLHEPQVQQTADAGGLLRFGPSTLQVWSIPESEEAFVLRGHSRPVQFCSFSRDAQTVYARVGTTEIAWATDTRQRRPEGFPQVGPASDSRKNISSDGKWKVVPRGNDVLLVDLHWREKAHERALVRTRFANSAEWHAQMASLAESERDWYAGVFHRAWQLQAMRASTPTEMRGNTESLSHESSHSHGTISFNSFRPQDRSAVYGAFRSLQSDLKQLRAGGEGQFQLLPPTVQEVARWTFRE